MNKNELISKVASSTSISETDVTSVIEATLEAIAKTLKDDNEIRLVGFGNFSLVHRAAAVGHNPKTGEKIQIPALKIPRFKASKALKDSVNGVQSDFRKYGKPRQKTVAQESLKEVKYTGKIKWFNNSLINEIGNYLHSFRIYMLEQFTMLIIALFSLVQL